MDLPQVTLAAVLAADGLLHRPDLRASEQALQLLMQLAGRAGRGERPGRVLVQTYCPDHPVIRHLVGGGTRISWPRRCGCGGRRRSCPSAAPVCCGCRCPPAPRPQRHRFWRNGYVLSVATVAGGCWGRPQPRWHGWQGAADGSCCSTVRWVPPCRFPRQTLWDNFPTVWLWRWILIPWSCRSGEFGKPNPRRRRTPEAAG